MTSCLIVSYLLTYLLTYLLEFVLLRSSSRTRIGRKGSDAVGNGLWRGKDYPFLFLFFYSQHYGVGF